MLIRLVLSGCVTLTAAFADDWKRAFDSATRDLQDTDARVHGAAVQALEAILDTRGQEALDYLEGFVLPRLTHENKSDVAVRSLRTIALKRGCSRMRWWVATAPSVACEPHLVVEGDTIVCTGEGGIEVLGTDGAGVRWSKPGSFEKAVPGILRGAVYAYRPPNAVVGYRGNDGALLWAQAFDDLGLPAARTRRVQTPAGEVRREIPAAELRDAGMHAVLDPDEERIYVAVANRYVVAVTGAGKRLWVHDEGGDKGLMWGPTVVPRRSVLMGGYWHGARRLFALSTKDGSRIWGIDCPAANVPPVVCGESVVIATASTVAGYLVGELQGVALCDGRVLWKAAVSDCMRSSHNKPADEETEVVATPTRAVERGTLERVGSGTDVERLFAFRDSVIGETTGARFCLRASDGELLWSTARGRSRFHGSVCDGLLLGSADDGAVLTMDPTTGRIVRRIELASMRRDLPLVLSQKGDDAALPVLGRLSLPWYSAGVVYVLSESGCLIALQVPSLRSEAEMPAEHD